LTPYQVKRILFREDQATPLPPSSPDHPVFPVSPKFARDSPEGKEDGGFNGAFHEVSAAGPVDEDTRTAGQAQTGLQHSLTQRFGIEEVQVEGGRP
jgi:hypothetical protein